MTDAMIQEAQDIGAKYETVVDALKFAKYDQLEIVVDEKAREVTIYEEATSQVAIGASWITREVPTSFTPMSH
ncbi:MAG: hypothetical protein JOZ31_24975 [Verrucomicrobia bacterium]|nr:hypothetical protein [Verrucomicrobiota bacterium]